MPEQEFGSSANNCDYILKRQIEKLTPKTIVDFGPGAGKIGEIIRDTLHYDYTITGVEGCAKTASMLAECGLYDKVHHCLIQDWIRHNSSHYDLAIFGDVLEHLSHKELRRVVKKSLQLFDHVIIHVPLHAILQDDAYGNPLEIHRSYITERFFDRYRPTQKHIVTDGYTIMNVMIQSRRKQELLLSSLCISLFHLLMVSLQPLGLARHFIDLVRPYGRFLKRKLRLDL